MCDPKCSLESVNKENNTTITTSKKQVTFEPEYVKSQSNKDKNRKNEYDIKKFLKYCPSAPCARETLENESVERENTIEVQKSTSAPIKLQYVECQNNNEDKQEIALQTNPALNDPECVQNQKEYVEETDIGIQTNPSQYVITKSEKQNELQYVECQNNNEENKEIPTLTNPECVKGQNIYDVEKYNSDQTIYRNISTEQIKSIGPNYTEEQEIAVQTNPAPTHKESLKRQMKCGREKKCHAQTKYIQHRNITKERIECKPCVNTHNYNEENKVNVHKSPESVDSECFNRQTKNKRENDTAVKKRTSALVKPECVPCKNYNEEEKDIGVQTNPAQHVTITNGQEQTEPGNVEYINNNKGEEKIVTQPNTALIDPEKNQQEYVEETDIGIQTNPSQYVITKSQKQSNLQYVEYKNNNEENKEIAVKISPASTKCVKCEKKQKKSDAEKYNPDQTIYRNISEEQIKSKGQNYDEEKEIVVQTNPVPTDQECLKRQIKNKREKKTAAQTKLIKYRNISTERIDGSYVGIENSNNQYKKIAIQPNPALTGPECLKWQYKNDGEKNAGVYSKYIKLRNISGKQIEHKPCSKIQNYYEEEEEDEKDEEEDIVVQTNPAPTDQECLKRKIKYEREKETAAQTKLIKYRSISKERIDGSYVGIQNNNNKYEEIVIQPNPALTSPECMKWQNKNDVEKNAGVHSKYIKFRNISGEQIEHRPCGKIQNLNEEEKEEEEIVVQTNPAPTDQECLKRKINYEREKETSAQTKLIKYRNISKERIDGSYVGTQNNNNKYEEIVIQPNPALTSPECMKWLNKNDVEKNAGVHSKYIKFRNISGEQIEHKPCGKIQNFNEEEEKEIVVKTNPVPTDQECLKRKIKYEREKETAAQTKYIQYRNRSGEQIEHKPCGKIQNFNEEDKESVVKTNPAPTDQECLKRKIKYESEKETAAQTKYIQYRNISKERIAGSYVGIQNNNNKYKENVIQPNPSLTGPEGIKWQNKNDGEKHVDVHSKYIQFRNRSGEHIEYKPSVKIQNYNEEEEKEIAVQTNPAPTDQECLKRKIKYEREKETAAQTKYIQYRNISKERIDGSYVGIQNNNNKHKEIVIQPNPASMQLMKWQNKNDGEKHVDVHLKHIQFRNRPGEHIEYKPSVKIHDYNEEEEKEISVQTSPVPTDPKCLRSQIKHKSEKETAAKTEYMQYQNISKERIDEPYVKSQSNTRENKNALRPCSTLTDQECMKRQSKNVEEKNIDVQGKSIEYRNIDYVKSETICTSATCVAKTLKNESDGREEAIAVQARMTAPIELECNEIQNNNEEKKDIGLQKNPAQPITNEQKQSELQYMKCQNYKEKIEYKPYIECQNYKGEEEIADQTNSPHYKYVTKDQKQTEPDYVKSEINQYYANQDSIESRNIKQTSKKSEAFISKIINSTEYFENEFDKQEKDIDVLCKKLTKKTFAHTCIENEKYSSYVTSKDYSKPKNFQHLFTRKNFGNSSQYNTKEENLHGCCIKCSKYMTTADYNKPDRFARLFSVPKLWDTEDSKLIKSSDDYSKDLISQNSKRKYEKSVPKLWNTEDSKLIKSSDYYSKDLISQNSKRIDSKDFTKQYTFEVVCKDEKSDDEYLALKQRKVKEVINPNNTSTVYRYAKKCIENRTILKSLIYTKNKPEKSKASESNSATSIYGILKNMFANN